MRHTIYTARGSKVKETLGPYDPLSGYLVNPPSSSLISNQVNWPSLREQEMNANFGLDVSAVTGWSKGVYTPTVAALTMSVSLLNGIAQGTAPGQRIGNVINMDRVLWGNFGVAAATLSSWVVYDKGCNGAFPSLTNANNQVLSIDNANGALLARPDLNTVNLLYRDRFIILANYVDGTVDLNDMQSVPLHGLPTVYSDSGSTIASIRSGALYLITCASTGYETQYLTTFSE